MTNIVLMTYFLSKRVRMDVTKKQEGAKILITQNILHSDYNQINDMPTFCQYNICKYTGSLGAPTSALLHSFWPPRRTGAKVVMLE